MGCNPGSKTFGTVYGYNVEKGKKKIEVLTGFQKNRFRAVIAAFIATLSHFR